MWDKIFAKLNLNLSSSQKKSLLIILILALALPFTIALVKQTQIFKPRAEESAQTHSVVNFDPKVEQILSPGDTLSGKGIPEAKVSVSITPDGVSSEVDVDKEGRWTYQIPPNIQSKNYNLTVIIKDIEDNIASIKSYSIKITSPIKSGMTLGIKPAYAQGNSSSQPSCIPLIQEYCPTNNQCVRPGDCPQSTKPITPIHLPVGSEENYGAWEEQMRAFGIYPAVENGEIVLYSKEAYDAKYCQQACIYRQDSPEEIIRRARLTPDFLTKLVYRLKDQGYAPITTLEPYFPNVREVTGFRVRTLDIQGFPPDIDGGPLIYGKTTIDKATLASNIQAVYTDIGWRNAIFNQHFGDPVKVLITLSDPIFGTRSLVDVLSLPASQVNDETRLNALLGMSFIFGMSEKVAVGGIRLAADSTINVPNMINDVRGIRNSVQTLRPGNQPIPLSSIRTRARSAGWIDTFVPIRSNLRPIVTGLQGERLVSAVFAKRVVEEGKGYVLDPEITRPLMNNLLDNFESWTRQTGSRININRSQIMEVIDKHLVIVFTDPAEFLKFCTGNSTFGGGCAGKGMVALSSNYNSTGALAHEFVHQIMHSFTERLRRAPWVYETNPANLTSDLEHYVNIMTYFMEQGTEFAVGRLFPQSGYKDIYNQHFYDAINTLISRINSRCRSCLSNDDFIEFAVTLDDQVLMRKILPYMSAQEFVNIVKRTLDMNLIGRVFVQYRAQAAARASNNWVPLIAAGSASVGLGIGIVEMQVMNQVALNLAQGRQIPEDTVIIMEPIDVPDTDFILDRGGDDQIEITGVVGEGDSKTVSFVIHDNGVVVDPDQFDVTFTLDPLSAQNSLIKNAYAFTTPSTISQIQALTAQRISPNSYLVTLTNPADANLEACISKKGSADVISCGSQRISGTAAPSPQPTSEPQSSKTVTSVKINGQDAYSETLGNPILSLTLPGVEGRPYVFSVPVEVTYSDETSKSFVLTFSYLNDLSNAQPPSNFSEPGSNTGSTPSPTPLPESTPRCNLTSNGSSSYTTIASGNYISFNLTNIPDGASSATWLGTGGTIPSSIDPFTILPGRVWNKILGPYSSSSIGSYTRKIVVSDVNGSPLCQSNTVNITVSGSIQTPGQCTLPGSRCGGSNPPCCTNSSCVNLGGYSVCQQSYSVPTQAPVSVTNPTSIPTPTPSCKRVNQSCNLDTDCCPGIGRCLFGSGSSKVCR